MDCKTLRHSLLLGLPQVDYQRVRIDYYQGQSCINKKTLKINPPEDNLIEKNGRKKLRISSSCKLKI